MPRPRKPICLTEHVQTLLLAALRNGSYFETAAAFAGVSRDSLWRWLRDGRRNPDGPCGEFARLVDKALAESELSHLRNIRDAGQNDWRASAWLLGKRHPERWGDKLRVQVDEDNTADDSDLDGYTADELQEILSAIEVAKRKLTKRKLQAPAQKPTH